MGIIIDRGAAYIEAYAVGIERGKHALFPGQGVVELEVHRVDL